MTRRVFELRHGLFTFFKDKIHEFKDDLENDEFISRLAYEVELPEVPLAVENRTLMILREYLRPN